MISVESNEASNNDKQSKVKELPFNVTLLGVDISELSQTAQFALVSVGVFFFFVIYGYLLVSSDDFQ